VSIFKNSWIEGVASYLEGMPGPVGSVMTVRFVLDGEEFIALNGGPVFKFSQAVSFLVNCDTQEEVDELWTRLSEGGEEGVCGWLTDKFGLSWQIVPTVLGEMLSSSDTAAAQRASAAMLAMKKLDIAGLQRAYDGA
jgi:predicted 3-demethylubiquinone-9 3-methyltransferase (glyoxalase superfamily)